MGCGGDGGMGGNGRNHWVGLKMFS
jgi:hypothetical protein